MSLIPGNVEVLAFAPQVDKATPAATPIMAIALEDCTLSPNPQYITLAETDSAAVQPDDVVVSAQPGGTFKKYLRPSEDDFLLYALLGKNVDTGAGAPYTHTANPDPTAPFATPYLTVWDIWPSIGCVRYDGCRLSQLALSSQEGGGCEGEYTIEALVATMGVAQPDLTGLQVDEQPFTWAELAVSLGGVHGGIVSDYSLTINRNINRFMGDNGLESLDIPNGLLAVSGSLTAAFEDDQLWRAANTGTTAGTVLTTSIYEESLAIDHTRGAALEAKFALNAARITNYQVKLATDGKPATASFDFKSKRDDTLSNVIQTIFKNAVATGDRS